MQKFHKGSALVPWQKESVLQCSWVPLLPSLLWLPRASKGFPQAPFKVLPNLTSTHLARELSSPSYLESRFCPWCFPQVWKPSWEGQTHNLHWPLASEPLDNSTAKGGAQNSTAHCWRGKDRGLSSLQSEALLLWNACVGQCAVCL